MINTRIIPIHPQIKQTRGYILIMAMSMLLILTLLAMGAAETSLLLMKETQANWSALQAQQATENMNRHWMETLRTQSRLDCLVPMDPAEHYWSTTPNSWEAGGCIDTQMGVTLSTVVELLPDTLCLEEKTGSVQQITFLRLTTAVKDLHQMDIHIQRIFPVFSPRTVTCQHTAKGWDMAAFSWRMN